MENKTEMTNPPMNEAKMVAPKKEKTFKLLAMREFQVGEKVVKPGDLVEVTKDQAKDLCKKLQGGYAFSGERHNKDGDIIQHDLTRARLATAADLVEKKPLTPLTEEENELFKD